MPDMDEDAGCSPSIDTLMDAVAVRRRRFILYHLRDDGATAFDAVIEQVVEWETDLVDEEFDDHHQQVRADLRHVHLPTLADAELVEYDDRSEQIRYYGHCFVEDILDVLEPHDLD